MRLSRSNPAISKIIFVNRYGPPDQSATSQMLSGIAFALAQGGETVHVIASRMRYDDPEKTLSASETVDGVVVTRVLTTRFGRASLIGRAIDYATFYLSASWALAGLARRGDVVISKTDPPMLAIVTGPISRLRGAHHVNWLQDVFPEVAEALGRGTNQLSRLVFQALRGLRNAGLRRSDLNVVLGRRMARHIETQGIDPATITIIGNWADGKLIVPKPAHTSRLRGSGHHRVDLSPGGNDPFVVGYSGNLGRAHDISTILKAMSLLREPAEFSTHTAEPGAPAGDFVSGRGMARVAGGEGAAPTPATAKPIHWLFVGGGARMTQLRQAVTELGFKNVDFLDYLPREGLSDGLAAADVHLVSLQPELEGLIVPSKFYGIAAAGRASILIGAPDGELGLILDQTGAGLTVPQGDGELLAHTIRSLASDPRRVRRMGDAARRAFDESFDLVCATNRWRHVIAEVRGGKQR